jgi:hypothetical protein
VLSLPRKAVNDASAAPPARAALAAAGRTEAQVLAFRPVACVETLKVVILKKEIYDFCSSHPHRVPAARWRPEFSQKCVLQSYTALIAPPDPLEYCVGFDWDEDNAGKNRETASLYGQIFALKNAAEDVFFHQPLVIRSDARHSKREK